MMTVRSLEFCHIDGRFIFCILFNNVFQFQKQQWALPSVSHICRIHLMQLRNFMSSFVHPYFSHHTGDIMSPICAHKVFTNLLSCFLQFKFQITSDVYRTPTLKPDACNSVIRLDLAVNMNEAKWAQ